MRRDQVLLSEIVDAAERVISLAHGRTAEDFASDRDRREALLWNFTVLGEAIAQLSESIRTDHSDVPWNDPIRLRNRIVHGYWSIDLDVLLATARNDLPAFLIAVRAITMETSLNDDDE
jgi:uncharacterized protein with HEPN domain